MPTEYDHEEEVLYAETAEDLGPFGGVIVVELIAVRLESLNFGRCYLLYSYAHTGHAEDAPFAHERRELLNVATDAAAQRVAIGLFDSLLRELNEAIEAEEGEWVEQGDDEP